ncbi:transcription factor IIA, alpha/beta subunit-domain-containing protein [Kockovaella imperatae]|uniref:Transcription factor IIA, alpha/beta subunit-domain-containing protein n=1 Tax=Kockovaella imperatae TaxID=4999 RepID=A0A1Y1UGL5_9TREE|nr:transcription factor IIA, alpha/beta subunit-domain-containing protein [Kockovaella imperatae]ORX37168.1 transcription factor IIA, alpha/beta subunit-domain-containing protein [Kockovaella imperatae]
MEEDVLINLQAKWEAKLLETRVADFARAPGVSGSPDADGDSEVSRPSGATAASSSTGNPNQAYSYQPANQAYGLALPGQNMAGPSSMMNGKGRPPIPGNDVRVKSESDDVLRIRGGKPDDNDDGESDIKPNVKPEPNAAGLLPGDEVIDSDLDDSDDELKDGDEDGEDGAEVDIVFCVYDKVQRVKNKWKTTFKDGMIHINGRDYLFAKCSGEFEW